LEDPKELTKLQEYWPYTFAVIGWVLYIWQLMVNKRKGEREEIVTIFEKIKITINEQLKKENNPQTKQDLEDELVSVLASEKEYYVKTLGEKGITGMAKGQQSREDKRGS